MPVRGSVKSNAKLAPFNPVNAQVEAAPNFLSNLETAHQFFVIQDADSANERFRKLKTELREMVAARTFLSTPVLMVTSLRLAIHCAMAGSSTPMITTR